MLYDDGGGDLEGEFEWIGGLLAWDWHKVLAASDDEEVLSESMRAGRC